MVRGDGVCDVLKRLGCAYAPVVVEGGSETLTTLVTLEELGFYRGINPPSIRVFRNTLKLLYLNWLTPIVRLESLSRGSVWVKLEWYNPYSCSIKDGVAWYMLKKALEKLGWVNTLYEATSTNTGLALATLANILGLC